MDYRGQGNKKTSFISIQANLPELCFVEGCFLGTHSGHNVLFLTKMFLQNKVLSLQGEGLRLRHFFRRNLTKSKTPFPSGVLAFLLSGDINRNIPESKSTTV